MGSNTKRSGFISNNILRMDLGFWAWPSSPTNPAIGENVASSTTLLLGFSLFLSSMAWLGVVSFSTRTASRPLFSDVLPSLYHLLSWHQLWHSLYRLQWRRRLKPMRHLERLMSFLSLGGFLAVGYSWSCWWLNANCLVSRGQRSIGAVRTIMTNVATPNTQSADCGRIISSTSAHEVII